MKLSQRCGSVRDCVHLVLYVLCVCVSMSLIQSAHMLQYASTLTLTILLLDPIEYKLKQFFIFFRFVFLIISFIFPHFVRLHSSVCHSYTSSNTILPISVHRASWTMWIDIYSIFYHPSKKNETHCLPLQPVHVSASFLAQPIEHDYYCFMWKTECIKHINNILLSTNRMKLLNISFWWLFYAKTMSIMILLPDWIEKRIKSSDQHTHARTRIQGPTNRFRCHNDAFGQHEHSLYMCLTWLKGTIP